jgi:hypothetical protein
MTEVACWPEAWHALSWWSPCPELALSVTTIRGTRWGGICCTSTNEGRHTRRASPRGEGSPEQLVGEEAAESGTGGGVSTVLVSPSGQRWLRQLLQLEGKEGGGEIHASIRGHDSQDDDSPRNGDRQRRRLQIRCFRRRSSGWVWTNRIGESRGRLRGPCSVGFCAVKRGVECGAQTTSRRPSMLVRG